MNANQLINMVIRMVMRQVVGRGLNAGIDMASRKMSKGESRDGGPTPESREMADRTKKSMKVARRVGRF